MNVFQKSCCALFFGAISCASPAAKPDDIPLPEGVDNIIAIDSSRIVNTSSHLHLQLIAPSKCALGEPLEVTMRYILDGDGKLAINVADFDRSGRVAEYSFYAWGSDKNAVRDPANQLTGSSMGGARGRAELMHEKPYEQKVVANQWLAFDKTGTYFLTARSTIVRGNSDASPPLSVESEPIQIEITKPDETSRKSRLELADDVLKIEDREIDQINRQTRFEAVRSLRFMIDERAIPLLVRALNDGFVNVRFEAELGLRAFKDMAPVKAELLRALNDDNFIIEPRAKNSYYRVLMAANVGLSSEEKRTQNAKYEKLFDAKLLNSLKKMPDAKAAETVVEAMKNYQMSRGEAANWNRVLDVASKISLESQKEAAELLLHQMIVKPSNDTVLGKSVLLQMQPAMRQVARDESVNGLLRSACIVGLSKSGDDSFRDLLVSEFVKARPALWQVSEWGHPWDEAQKTLNGYKSEEIAQQLLKLFNAPDFFKIEGYERRSIGFRLSDFAQSLSIEQLRGATKRVLQSPTEWDNDIRETLLKALARKSPDDVLPFLKSLPIRNPKSEWSFRANMMRDILTRLSTRSARKLTLQEFQSPGALERAAIIDGFSYSAQSARDKYYDASPDRYLPIRPDVAKSFFPQILHAFQTDASPEVRTSAFYSLSQISNIPVFSYYDLKNADDKTYVAQWQKWWKAQK